jgi:hypothetical protein
MIEGNNKEDTKHMIFVVEFPIWSLLFCAYIETQWDAHKKIESKPTLFSIKKSMS